MLFKRIHIEHHTEMLQFCKEHLANLRLLEAQAQKQHDDYKASHPEFLYLVEELQRKIAAQIKDVIPKQRQHEDALAELLK
jgi:hypothetical protein